MRNKTCLRCSSNFPTKIVIDGKERNLQNRKLCLECSPFGSRNHWKLKRKETKNAKSCTKCLVSKSLSEFYENSSGKLHSYCKPCLNGQRIDRQRQLKNEALSYKGGKCVHCGYNRYPGALEFHHRDPTKKDIKISKFGRKSITATVKTELDKCDLLCANCHREEHARMSGCFDRPRKM